MALLQRYLNQFLSHLKHIHNPYKKWYLAVILGGIKVNAVLQVDIFFKPDRAEFYERDLILRYGFGSFVSTLPPSLPFHFFSVLLFILI